MDLEMTGLDPKVERILEIATIITDSSLQVIAEGPVFCVAQPQSLLDAMDDWNTAHHNASGLVDRVKREGISEEMAEAKTLEFIRQYVEPGQSPLCGNSIAQDRRFLVEYMPTLESYLHYRNIDVSTIKELAVRWRPDVYEAVKKVGAHRAVDDIRESIAELLTYRQLFFRLQP
jgi:oligoribonuclease